MLWNPALFGSKPELVVKGGQIAWSQMGKNDILFLSVVKCVTLNVMSYCHFFLKASMLFLKLANAANSCTVIAVLNIQNVTNKCWISNEEGSCLCNLSTLSPHLQTLTGETDLSRGGLPSLWANVLRSKGPKYFRPPALIIRPEWLEYFSGPGPP